MRALVWDDGMGEDWLEEPTSRTTWSTKPRPPTPQLIDVVSNHDDIIMEKYLGDEEILPEDLTRALRTVTLGNHAVPILCGSAFKNKGVQPMLDAVVDYLPCPSTSRRPGPVPRKEGIEVERPADDYGPLLGPGLQDHDRPLRRQAHLPAGLLGHADQGLGRDQLDQGPQGADRPHPADARQPPRGPRRHVRRRHRGRGRAQADHHRRHPVRPGQPVILESLDLPRAGHPRGRRAQDQG